MNRSSKLMLVGVVLLMAVLEVSVRFGIGRASRIQGRIEREDRAALSIRAGIGGKKSVLIVGNSLLLEGVDFPLLQESLAPQIRASRFAVEQTDYLDCYYWLRRLYRHGARPDVLIVSLSGAQMFADDVRGDYFGYQMMDTRDFLRVSRDAGLSATQTFSLLLGNLSAFYGTRTETRKVLLARLIPGVADLVSSLVPVGVAPPLERELAVPRLSGRLAEMDRMVRAHGGRFILAQPASLNLLSLKYLSEAGRKTGVPVLEPLPPESLSLRDFRDGFHLTPEAASRYTSALVPMIREAAGNP